MDSAEVIKPDKLMHWIRHILIKVSDGIHTCQETLLLSWRILLLEDVHGIDVALVKKELIVPL